MKKKNNIPIFKTLLTEALKKFERSHPDKLNEAKRKSKERHPSKQLEIDEELEAFNEIVAGKDVDAWYEVKHAIVDKKNEVITNILHSKSPFFHPDRKKNDLVSKSKSALAPIKY